VSRYATLASLISDLHLSDLNYLLSGKPTFWERPFKGRLGGGFRPKADIKVKTTLRYFGIS